MPIINYCKICNCCKETIEAEFLDKEALAKKINMFENNLHKLSKDERDYYEMNKVFHHCGNECCISVISFSYEEDFLIVKIRIYSSFIKSLDNDLFNMEFSFVKNQYDKSQIYNKLNIVLKKIEYQALLE